jgi:DNA (cytosine-5)-methyltransferase 1
MNIKYGSLCSGIEAATSAWHSLGWMPQWFSEIENFPSAVLEHHYPDVPNYGDMTKFKEWPNDRSIDLLVGGTPCQSFSVAGLRKGLTDPRGNLMLTYLAIAARYSPRWLVWENVPGVLSSNGGRDFGTFLGALGKLGYGFAYRVLDAQYFGVAQRRRRVFVVGYLGDWRRAAAVLFERESLSGHSAPSRKEREEVAKCLTSRVGNAYDGWTEQFVTKFVPSHDKVGTLTASYGMGGVDIETKPVVFGAQNSANQGLSASTEVSPTLDTSKTPAVKQNMEVRRLTPTECERLQGFPDNYTQIPYRNKDAEQCPDGPRYKAMGNSMAVPVMRWIGERIEKIEKIK